MPSLCRAALGAATALVLGCAAGRAGDLRLTRPAGSGQSTLLGYERSWSRDCADTGVTVTITGQPAHGTVAVTQGMSVIPASTPRFGSTGRCAGRPIAGNEVMYRSEAGFHGRDHVRWHVVYGSGASGDTDVTVLVR